MRVLVTGGAGFIGSNFIRFLLSNRRDLFIVNFDKLTYAGNLGNLEDVASDPNYRFVRGDICSSTEVLAAMQACDAVVHFAAESHVDRSIYEPGPVIQTNITGTFILLKVAKELGIGRFVHVSTDEVYGDMRPDQSAVEETPMCPNSPYSASKASSDLLVRSFVKTYNFPAIITRASNNYGPRQFPEKFIPLAISNAMANKPIPIYGDGLQERDWLHVMDHCKGILAVLEKGRCGEIYNIGGNQVEKNLTIVHKLLAILGRSEELLQYVIDRPGHDRRYSLDCSKIKRELGWSPTLPMEQGLSDTVDWYAENHSWLDGVRSGEYKQYYELYYGSREAALKAVSGLGR